MVAMTIELKLQRKYTGLPWWLSGKEPSANVGDLGWSPGSGRFSGEGNGNLLYYSCLGNPMDREARQATVPGDLKRVGYDLAGKA